MCAEVLELSRIPGYSHRAMVLRAFIPDLLVSGARVLAGAALTVRDGVVAAVGAPLEGAELVRLPGAALLPGLVTAHSHAFQRAIRGRTEYRKNHVDDFWTWRDAMYAAAERLGPDDLYAVSKMCFLEMARAGITCVGEFHYLHRDASGRPYADANELDKQVLRAAREVGLRVVMLRVAYARAGFQLAENPRQRRFIEGSAEEYLANLDALAHAVRGDALAGVGAAPHSVRACPAPWIAEIAAEARKRAWPLHLHVSEQPAEVEQCRAEHGLAPPRLLEKLGALGERTTAVHAVHLDAADIAALGHAGACVCACPTTERNLGDGVVRADRLLEAGVRLCLGSDSEVQLSPLEDARALEYHLRLVELRRAVLDPGAGRVGSLGARLYAIASEGGMRSLGLPGGSLQVSEPADFLVADLDDPSIAGASADDLLAAVVFSLERTAIREVRVAGEPIVREGRTGLEAQVLPPFRAAMRRLWS
jgi:formimidoylglutamate deiminase